MVQAWSVSWVSTIAASVQARHVPRKVHVRRNAMKPEAEADSAPCRQHTSQAFNHAFCLKSWRVSCHRFCLAAGGSGMAKATAKGKMAKKPSGGGKAPRTRPVANVDVSILTVDDDYSFGTICSDCLKEPDAALGWMHCDHRDCPHIVCFTCIMKYRLCVYHVKKNFMSCTHCNAWPSRR